MNGLNEDARLSINRMLGLSPRYHKISCPDGGPCNLSGNSAMRCCKGKWWLVSASYFRHKRLSQHHGGTFLLEIVSGWCRLERCIRRHRLGSEMCGEDGSESYQLADGIWEAIGAETARAGTYIPSAYGSWVPDVAQDKTTCTAESWSFWTQYIGPVLLRNRFQNVKYILSLSFLYSIIACNLRLAKKR